MTRTLQSSKMVNLALVLALLLLALLWVGDLASLALEHVRGDVMP